MKTERAVQEFRMWIQTGTYVIDFLKEEMPKGRDVRSLMEEVFSLAAMQGTAFVILRRDWPDNGVPVSFLALVGQLHRVREIMTKDIKTVELGRAKDNIQGIVVALGGERIKRNVDAIMLMVAMGELPGKKRALSS